MGEPEGDGAAGAGERPPLPLISWNVAGWTSTHALVRRHYGGLAPYLGRFGHPAFFCVQETKVQNKDLRNAAAAKDLGAIVEGYRSFWAFNEEKHPRGLSLQGVATWVREDIPVLGATQQVFGIPELDRQGRALLTDHGAVAVINVYVPFAGSGEEKSDVRAKLQLLQELSRVMGRLREQGKRVVLCGDLNLTHRPVDQKPGRRVLWVDDAHRACAELPRDDVPALLAAWGQRAIPAPTDGSGDAPEATAPAISVEVWPAAPGADSGQRSRVSVGPLPEWAEQWVPVQEVCDRAGLPAAVLAPAGECGHIREAGCVQWLRSLVSPPQTAPWADVFAEVHPTAEERFTSWSQAANARYSNGGSRIDYVIADRATFDRCVVRSPSECLPGAVSEEDRPGAQAVAATSAQAAANAATHFGGWHACAVTGMAAGDGMSLQMDNMRLNDTQFPKAPYTGLLYTPPCYSDHIPVSAVFARDLLERLEGASEPGSLEPIPDKQTKQSQPWLAQPSIATFFGATPPRAASQLQVPTQTPPAVPAPARAAAAREVAPAAAKKRRR